MATKKQATRKEQFMNVEIAQRLAELRRKKGYSQEELAENLGLSRQAVSKWERAESSPDTGNLIALAKLYGVSLDELLSINVDIEDDVKFEARDKTTSTEAEVRVAAEQANLAAAQAQAAAAQAQAAQVQAVQAQAQVQAATPVGAPAPAAYPQSPYVQFQSVPQAQAQAPYGEQSGAFPVSQTHSFAEPSTPEKKKKGPWLTFPYPILCVIVFLFAGFFNHAWHPAWIVFLTIPLYYWIAVIIENDPNYRK